MANKITISYAHPVLGGVKIKDVQEVHVLPLDFYSDEESSQSANGVFIIAYRSAKGEHVKLTTNVPFVVREGEYEPAAPIDSALQD